jgi:hypothetical protein
MDQICGKQDTLEALFQLRPWKSSSPFISCEVFRRALPPPDTGVARSRALSARCVMPKMAFMGVGLVAHVRQKRFG